MATYCPIALFAYRRPQHLRAVVDSLLANPEAEQSDLYIFCDAARKPADSPDVAAVRKFANSVSGFRSVTVVERISNLGLSRSITSGVSELCDRYGRVAVVEDDVVVSRHFLGWINAALAKYESDDRVISIGCYVFPDCRGLPDTFFLNITDCWGWAVWKRSWDRYESDGDRLLHELTDRGLEHRFDLDGSYPYTQMLRDQIVGGNDSWAVRWYATAVLTGGLTLYPGSSMTTNIGFDGSGEHGGTDRGYAVDVTRAMPTLQTIPVIESVQGRALWAAALGTKNESTIKKLGRRIREALRRG
jgi:hypothetical protein